MTAPLPDLLAGGADGPSSASLLAAHFEARGLARAEVAARHLDPVYAVLRTTAHPPGRSKLKFDGLPATSPGDPPVLGVIVETRAHPALERVVRQFARRLGIPIQLFHGTANETHIRQGGIAELVDSGQVRLTPLPAEHLAAPDYNALLLSPSFWQALGGRNKILVFQVDSVLCEASPWVLEDFTGFEYIGSNWPRRRPVGLVMDGGSGGLSLREWQCAVDCLQRFPPANWPGGEDGYFAFHLDLAGAGVACAGECARFSTQNTFTEPSFGAHQVALLGESDRAAFLDYCPEGRFLLADDS